MSPRWGEQKVGRPFPKGRTEDFANLPEDALMLRRVERQCLYRVDDPCFRYSRHGCTSQ